MKRILPVFKDELKSLLFNRSVREALRRVAERYIVKRVEALSKLGSFVDVRKRLRDIKERGLGDSFELWSKAREKLEAEGVVFIEAEDAKSACEEILKILVEDNINLLVKGKSITSEEIKLNSYLESKGITVIETDLGERILQLFGDKPSHLIVPAIHRTKEEVASLFSTYYKEELPPDPYVITKRVRKEFRDYFLRAKAGLTGINVVSANPLYFYLMTNEGNGRLCATMPDIYITLVGWEKIVETLEDALYVLKVLPRSAVGLEFSSYVSLFSKPFRWRPGRRWIVVLLDNGRKKALGDPLFRETLKCIRCGACMMVCPVYRVLSGQGFGKVYMGGIGVAWTAITDGFEEAAELAELCISCGSCDSVCPVGIPISGLVEEVRARVTVDNVLEDVAPHIVVNREIFSAIGEVARIAGVSKGESFVNYARRSGILNKGDATVFVYGGCVIEEYMPSIGIATMELFERLEVDAGVIGGFCCGLPFKVYGKKGEFVRTCLLSKEYMSEKKVVALCDSCYSTFLDADFVNVVSLYEYLLEVGVFIVAKRSGLKVLLHYPCHMRKLAKESKFLELMRSIDGCEVVENLYSGFCCGGGGLYRYKFPLVFSAISETKMESIITEKPDIIVTTCPSCVMNLKHSIKKKNIAVDVLHLSEFLVSFTRFQRV